MRSLTEVGREAVCLVLLVTLPAFFNVGVERIFEEEKALLLRAAAILLLCLAAARPPSIGELWRHPVVVALVAFSVLLAWSAVNAVAPFDSWLGTYSRRHGLATWGALLVVFWSIAVVARAPASRERVLQAMMLGSVWPSVYALSQAAGFDVIAWTDTIPGRAGSTAGNPLLLGGYLAVGIPLTAFECLRRRSYVALLLLQSAALLATGSRGPLAAAAVAMIAGTLALVGVRRPRVAIAGALLIAAASTAVIVREWPSSVFESGSGRVRVLIWKGLASSGQHTGWRQWVGYGPENLRLIAPRSYSAEIAAIEGTDAMPDRAHNETLDTFIAAGIPGAAAQLVLFGVVCLSALRVTDPVRRAALLAASLGHVLEIQLGIATVMSRLAFLTVAAVLVSGVDSPADHSRSSEWTDRPVWAGLAAGTVVMAAVTLTGARTEVLYVLTLAMTGVVAWALARRAPVSRDFARCAVAAVVAAVAAIPVGLVPSQADALSRVARELERRQEWGAAAATYRDAAALQPREPYYQTGLGRALLEQASAAEGIEQARLFMASREALDRALAINPFDPHHRRNLASLARRRAIRAGSSEARAAFLRDAEEHYAEATALAPQMHALWVEWANVAAESGRLDEAAARLVRAEALDPRSTDLWILRALLDVRQQRFNEALTAYDRVLALDPDSAQALRGRAVVLAQLDRPQEALSAVDLLLRVAPADDLGLRLRQALLADMPQ